MGKSVNSAFKEFMKNEVNLDLELHTKPARKDRDNLRDRIRALQNSVDGFPILASDYDVDFGSFARRTKKRPLDDVDMFFCLHGDGCTYDSYGGAGAIIHVHNESSRLNAFSNDDGTLNSIRVLNKFKKSVESVYQYRGSELNRRRETVILNLNNKEWSFDVVPCFITTVVDGSNFYLIPDGYGNWKKTDPRVDQERVTAANQRNDGNLLSLIRLVKYWNKRPTMPSMGSYLLENMVINCFGGYGVLNRYMDVHFSDALWYVRNNIFSYVADPKGFYGDLNDLSDEDKAKIYIRAEADAMKAHEARLLEDNSPSGTHKECINKWKEVFGPAFPSYE
ncbi:SMODS domain-containing nucleotidyltransferase [Chromohalobacter israelensis]|uniref:SMODS domain-containing nucleotidyltransferase n=1 Tax=Chromohalobacter israelensis TaxID=141390 RepID=UPI00265C4771|nr:nucleotidyltransferase [Chromohalobacter salexigens]MDO0944833.1 nucleotidyltransferase [Chromohalobacter salexigens]